MSDLVERLRKRAEIRRQISTRKSVQNGEPDRIADLLEEAATKLDIAIAALKEARDSLKACGYSEHEVFEALKELGENCGD